MSWRDELSLVLSREGAVPSSLFFRQADALRLDGCLTLLLREGQSLALSSHSEAALDHYAELLVHRLRRSAGCPVEIYFPASTAALVARFEERVARLTLKQAMEVAADPQPERIWLVHEAGALAAAELQLLTRLVTHFPGAGVRVVFLFGSSQPARQGFDGLGRRFARWDIAPPTADEVAAMRESARQDGTQEMVSLVIDRLLPAPAPTTTAEALLARSGLSSPVAASQGTGRTPARVQGWRRWLSALPGQIRSSGSAARPLATAASAMTDSHVPFSLHAPLGRAGRAVMALVARLWPRAQTGKCGQPSSLTRRP